MHSTLLTEGQGWKPARRTPDDLPEIGSPQTGNLVNMN